MKGLLSVSFGTSYPETRMKTIDAIDGLLSEAFSDRAFYTAWTSGRIIAKVRSDRAELHCTLDEALAQASSDGVDDLVVAVSCLMRGNEMKKIVDACEAWAAASPGRVVHIADPLLDSAEDRRDMARAVIDQFEAVGEDDALLIMGHGSHASGRSPRSADMPDPNEVYAQMQREFHALGKTKFFVATVEGTPTFDEAVEAIEACGAKRVFLAPFMIVAGDHARNDLAGDEDDSWKSQLEARGYAVEVALKGLGEYDSVRQIVCDHAKRACPPVICEDADSLG